MNFSNFSDRVRGWFPQREYQAPPPPTQAPNGQQAPVTIVMPAQPARKVSTPLLVVGGGIVLIAIYFAGHSSAKLEPSSQHPSGPTPTSPASIKDWNKPRTPALPVKTPQQQAEEDYQRSQQEAIQRANQMYAAGLQPNGMNTAAAPGTPQGAPALTPAQQAAEDRRKADEESLRASTVIAIPEAVPAPTERSQPTQQPQQPGVQYSAAPFAAATAAATTSPEDKTQKDCVDRMDGEVKKFALCEGSVLPAISEFRLVGEFAGPVKAEIASDIFSRDGKHLLIPRGTVALGDAKRVGTANQKRMDVSFHRMILPDGRGVVLEKMIALDQAGETALSGKVNRHLVSTFGTAALLGGLAGFSQIGSGSAYTGTGLDAYRQGVASNIGQQGQTLLQQGLNRPPDITVPEGKILMIYLSDDLHLPEFVPVRKEARK